MGLGLFSKITTGCVSKAVTSAKICKNDSREKSPSVKLLSRKCVSPGRGARFSRHPNIPPFGSFQLDI